MSTRQSCTALFALGLLTLSFTVALGHDQKPPAKQTGKPSQPAAPKEAAPDTEDAAPKTDPAVAFAKLVDSVIKGKDAVEVELAELSQYDELFQFLTKPANGKYVVKQLTLAKDDEVRILSVALHAPNDIFFTRGKEIGAAGFEGMYYVVDRTGWLKGAAFREGKSITEAPLGDVWLAYEREKTFWIWLAEQIARSK